MKRFIVICVLSIIICAIAIMSMLDLVSIGSDDNTRVVVSAFPNIGPDINLNDTEPCQGLVIQMQNHINFLEERVSFLEDRVTDKIFKSRIEATGVCVGMVGCVFSMIFVWRKERRESQK